MATGGRLYFPKMAPTTSSIPHGLLQRDLAAPSSRDGSNGSPPLESGWR